MVHDNIVLGAGISGLTAAATLRHGGHEVLVLEKSRGLGGRAATRRWADLPVDHGAQFFTARSDPFRAQVAAWKELGVCHEWCRGFHRYHDASLVPPEADHHPRYACRKGMSALGSALAEANGMTIERQSKVTNVSCQSRLWTLTCEDGKSFRTRRLILTTPPPQGADLLAEAVYGLPELDRSGLSGARLVACPGCYPTAAILAASSMVASNWPSSFGSPPATSPASNLPPANRTSPAAA